MATWEFQSLQNTAEKYGVSTLFLLPVSSMSRASLHLKDDLAVQFSILGLVI